MISRGPFQPSDSVKSDVSPFPPLGQPVVPEQTQPPGDVPLSAQALQLGWKLACCRTSDAAVSLGMEMYCLCAG